MEQREEWGPWIDHDGKGCPCRGQMVESIERRGYREIHIAGSVNSFGQKASAWVWGSHAYPDLDIIRYRIRKNPHVELMRESARSLDKLTPEVLRVHE